MTHTTPLTYEQLQQLTRPLSQNRVSVKQRMSYVEAWDIKATLIRIFGFGNFSSETIDSKILRSEQVAQVSNAAKMNWEITAQATVRLTIHQTGAVYQETAIAGSKQPDFTESADMAIKSAESDALKRAAIFLGTQFGLSLYNNGELSDVIGTVLAPGQEWGRGDVRPPSTTIESVIAKRLAEQASAEPGEHPGAADKYRSLPPGEGLTQEQHDANANLLERAMGMKAAKDAEQDPAGEDYQQHVADEPVNEPESN